MNVGAHWGQVLHDIGRLAVLNPAALRVLLPWKMKLARHEGREPEGGDSGPGTSGG